MRAPLALALLAPLSTQAATPPRVQGPDARWLTYRTAHYVIHTPDQPAFRRFAEEVATKIEGIHAQVTDGVGYEAPGPIHVLIKDPVLEANGSAWPFLARPWVELWITPPEPDSAIGHAPSWVDLLVVHELAHIHHLMRPQNRPTLWERLMDLPVGPVTRKAPRWVIEGYATVVEGRLTGSGRPHSAYRAAQLRQWALQGKLPDYGAVSGAGGFRGGSQAYLVGSAFLEWLERQQPQRPDLLKAFWKQLASRKRRDFEASFRATFGQAPRDAYDRWRAEVTHDALGLERRLKAGPGLREGALWAHIPGEVTDLAVSPDGTKLLARVLTPDFRGLRVWKLAPPADPPKAVKSAAPDPAEVEDLPPAVPTPSPAWSQGRFRNAVPRKPRWDADGQTVHFRWRTPGPDGALVDRPARWTPGRGAVATTDGPSPAPPQPSPWGVTFDGPRWELTLQTPGQPPRTVTRTLSAAWNPAPTPDGKAVFYTQLTATGVEIRRLDLTLPPLRDEPLPMDPAPLAPDTVLPRADEPSRLPAPGPVPPARPYRATDSLWNRGRSGFTVAPSGTSFQLGFGGVDLVQRFSWMALAAFGNGAGPRGATVAAAWNHGSWAPTLTLSSTLERPSAQALAPVAGWDRERRGALLTFTWKDRSGLPARLRPFAATERIAHLPGPTTTRTFGGLEALVLPRWILRENLAVHGSASLLATAGRTEGEGWHLQRGRLEVAFANPIAPFRLAAEAARVGGRPQAEDLLTLGGAETSLVPTLLEPSRLREDALPAHLRVGDRALRWRVEVGSGLQAFLAQDTVWFSAQPRPAAHRLAGLTYTLGDLMDLGPTVPLLGRINLTLTVARGLDGVLKGRTVGTASLVVRP